MSALRGGKPIEEPEEDFLVLPENWDTVRAFAACSNEWRRVVPGMGAEWVWMGLRKLECECIIRNLGHEGDEARDIFLGLLVMEDAALELLNKSGEGHG